MRPDDDPFTILGISPDSDAATVELAYKALAKRWHPDVSGPTSTEQMQRLNWARDELRRDLDAWRIKTIERRRQRAVELARNGASGIRVAATAHWIEVSPQVLIVSGVLGVQTTFAARAPGARPEDIRARVATDAPIELTRLGIVGDQQLFGVRLVAMPNFEGMDAVVVPIQVVANGLLPNGVFVSVQPLGAAVVNQVYPTRRIAPPRHPSADARVHFGQHKGRTYREVALENPEYLQWMIENRIQGHVPCHCARLALGLPIPTWAPAGPPLPSRERPLEVDVQAPVRPIEARRQALALPDPNAKRGLFGALRSLLPGRSRDQ